MKKNKQQKRWVQVQDFYIHTDRDSQGIQRYIQRLRHDRNKRAEIHLLQERDLEIFSD